MMNDARTASLTRTTRETDIALSLRLDAAAPQVEVDTGIGFFDHMLTALAFYGRMDLHCLYHVRRCQKTGASAEQKLRR